MVAVAQGNVLRLVLALVVVAVAARKSQILFSRHLNLAQLKLILSLPAVLRGWALRLYLVKLMGGREAQPHSRLAEAQQRCLHSAAVAVV